MCGIYCVYKQSRSCQLPFCASPIFHFEIGDFSVYLYIYIYDIHTEHVCMLKTSNLHQDSTCISECVMCTAAIL